MQSNLKAKCLHSRNERVQEHPRVSVIILNWNGWSDTTECLRSLYRIDYRNYYVIVVDNNSTDNSPTMIKEYVEKVLSTPDQPIKILEYSEFDAESGGGREDEIESIPSNKRLILIRNGENRGFAGGNNVGIRYSLRTLDAKYIMLLNNDTYVNQSFLNELVEAMEADEKIGSVQSLLLKPGGKLVDSLGQALVEGGAIDMGIGSKYEEEVNKTDIFGPCAAAALYRSALLREIGLFDESFFVIYEDVDLSWRIRLKGYSSSLVPSSLVYHKRGVSSKWKISKPSRIIRYYSIKNWLIIAIRYYPTPLTPHAIKRFLHYLFWCTLYALKLRRFIDTTLQLYNSIKIRKGLRKNAIWEELQSKWILHLSSDSITTPDVPDAQSFHR